MNKKDALRLLISRFVVSCEASWITESSKIIKRSSTFEEVS